MSLLLATHTPLWAVPDRAQLSARVLALLADGTKALIVSSASAWELATMHRLGKLPSGQALLSWFSDHLHRLRAEELPISLRHALTAGAQALLEDVPLVTRDAVVAAFPIRTLR